MSPTKTQIPADHEAILDWVDAGARERAERVLDEQAKLPPEDRDARLIVDLTAWLNGGDPEHFADPGDVKLPSTAAREQEMYEAELARWEQENPRHRVGAEQAGAEPDDPGASK